MDNSPPTSNTQLIDSIVSSSNQISESDQQPQQDQQHNSESKKSKKTKNKNKNKNKSKNKKISAISANADAFNKWYENILVEAEIIDKRYPVKGMPVYRPYGFYMHNKIMKAVEHEWDELGNENTQFPLLIPYSFLAKEGDHIKGFEKEVFWVTHSGTTQLEEKLALRPTSETAMYSMFSKWIQSYSDLPVQVYQTCSVYRYETSHTTPLIRVREIPWNEGHTAHATEEDAINHLEDVWKGYLRVINDLMGIYGLRLRRPEWDKFAGAEHTDVMDTILPSGKVLQSVGAHYLGTKFAKPFDIKYLNEENQFQHCFMTCYGVSTRLLASMIGIHGDKKGLVLPPGVARIQVVVMPVLFAKKKKKVVDGPVAESDATSSTTSNSAEGSHNSLSPEEINTACSKRCSEIVAQLKKAGIRATTDFSKKTPGEKWYYWEMKGVPLRLEIGPRELEENKLLMVNRNIEPGQKTGKKTLIDQSTVIQTVKDALDSYLNSLRSKALVYFNDHVNICNNIKVAKKTLNKKGGFVRVPFLGMDNSQECKEAEDKLKILFAEGEEAAIEVRGWRPEDPKPSEGTKCLATGKPATVFAYVARAY